MKSDKKYPLVNREISWLGFNERVLQEAEDERNPLIERFRFLGIFSNNSDEFYRVRVASLKRLDKLKLRFKKSLNEDPEEVLNTIQKMVVAQQNRFEQAYEKLIETAKGKSIYIINETQCNEQQKNQVETYFKQVVRTELSPVLINENSKLHWIGDKKIYLGVKMDTSKDDIPQFAIIEIPSTINRFKVLENTGKERYIILLDDIIRAHLEDIFRIFDYTYIKAYTFKLTRDAELDIDDDLSKGIIEQLSKSLDSRKSANPVRFVYDKKMPDDLRDLILKRLNINKDDNIIKGGRYHNFKDFIGFPSLDRKELQHPPLPPLKHPDIKGRNILDCVKKNDILLNYPYQSFDTIINVLREAALDPNVKSIQINLYRVAKNSKVINALINARKNGKKVVVIVELRARFDEENNIYWSNKLKDEGVEIIFGVPGLKVHSKLILISRKEKSKTVYYAHIGTGNFHEGTAHLYSDTSLLTADKRITKEISKVFDFFVNNFEAKRYSHIIISPTGSRRKFTDLIHQEIKNAKKGKEAEIILKLNNLVDTQMIKKLYEASQMGVQIKLIIRGICSLVPGVKGVSENISVISIIDRFLEHSRILYFRNGGDEKYFISSADWMARNLDGRIEVSTPIYDKKLQKILKDLLNIQLSDNVKARYIGEHNSNTYVNKNEAAVRAQLETYAYFSRQINP